MVEIPVGRLVDEGAQRAQQLLAADGALRQGGQAATDAELQTPQAGSLQLLAQHRLLGPRRLVGELLLPGGRAQAALHLRRTHAAGVGSPDHRAHAGTRQRVHRDAQFLQHLEHADVSQPQRAAAR
jgi:hypothetical protein